MSFAVAPRLLQEPAWDRLRTRMYVETDLQALVETFAAALTEDGFSGHQVVDRSGSTLFGDSPWLSSDGRAQAIAVGSAITPGRVMLLAGDDGCLASPRLRGFATLYVARGSTLLELRGDVRTQCPLTLVQRIIFSRMLAGQPPIDIASGLGLSIAALQVQIDRSTAALEARSSAAAVAEAARKGWLVAVPDTFRFPPDEKVS